MAWIVMMRSEIWHPKTGVSDSTTKWAILKNLNKSVGQLCFLSFLLNILPGPQRAIASQNVPKVQQQNQKIILNKNKLFYIKQ